MSPASSHHVLLSWGPTMHLGRQMQYAVLALAHSWGSKWSSEYLRLPLLPCQPYLLHSIPTHSRSWSEIASSQMRSGSSFVLTLSIYASLSRIARTAARPLPDQSLNTRQGETTPVQVQTWPGKPYVSFISKEGRVLDIANW
jgi:hypothetical protein